MIRSSTWRGLRDPERRGRLVEEDDLRLAQQRARDRDRLALASRERGDAASHVGDRGHDQARAARERACSISSSSSRGARAGPSLAPEEQVGDDVEVVAQREVLVDGRDAEAGARRSGVRI